MNTGPTDPTFAGSTSLPVPPRPLLGRAREIEEAEQLLLADEVRLLTLTGPGGVGKTRLALAVAGRLMDAFPAGIWFADLAPLRDPALVLPAVVAALGLRVDGGHSVALELRAALGAAHVLLVLDNCEHVLGALPAVGELLAACPGLKVLATSREPLGLLWEQIFPVLPLALPDPHRSWTVEAVGHAPAVALFVQRARAAQPNFTLSEANAKTVAELCARLDGLPLAIELAAAGVRLLPPAALLSRLRSRLDLLRASERDRPVRHQTLRATLDWSYDLLSPEEQRLLQRLTVFAGGCTLESAEAMGATLPALAALVDKGLVLREDEVGEFDVRFRLLETVREYALERLEAVPSDDAAARLTHATHFLALAERVEAPHIGQGTTTGFALLDREWDNLQAALDWSSDGGNPALSLRLAGALCPFWSWSHHRLPVGSGRGPLVALHWLELALARDPGPPGPDRLKILGVLGQLVAKAGDYTRAGALLEEATALARALDDTQGLAFTLASASGVAWQGGDVTRIPALVAGLEECRARGVHAWSLGWLLATLARLLHANGDIAAARRAGQEAVALFRSLGDAQGIALSLAGLADLAHEEGAVAQAIDLARDGLVAIRGAADPQPLANVAETAVVLDAARDERPGAAERRARVLGAIEVMREATRLARAPSQHTAYQRVITATRVRLGDEAFAASWQQGRGLSLDAALEEAITLLEPAQSPPRSTVNPTAAPASYGPLSVREVEVAALIGRGMTSKEIADLLVITERTADTHAGHIRDKLGLRSRAGIAAWAVRRGLLPEDEAVAPR